MRLLYFLLSLYLISYSCADRIILDEPPSQGIFPAGTYMDIRYRVRFEGMAKLHSASVALLNAETNQVITYFPAADWSEANSSVTRHGHALWYIPQNMPNGTYSIRVSGPCIIFPMLAKSRRKSALRSLP
ncbi:uncharacterized protein BYT42DRAFT_610309 [Radiomyces spectabilis]|uniref:uncharacterized protein n=1 Tax=Radiomyces spectabilis TaxID=64574 RepID=UPI00221E684C|nr:uncharacterized protein BYT42DRAFT_610309 [Radiomyces spectabilis]KAI8391045.1 hypothetical protein BYT42DRAFT_610309 [Radiomyces spectabilis]